MKFAVAFSVLVFGLVGGCATTSQRLQTKGPPTWDEKVASRNDHLKEFFRLRAIPRLVREDTIDGALDVVRKGEHRDRLLTVLRSRVAECRAFSSLDESQKRIYLTISSGRDASELGYLISFLISDDDLVERWFMIEESFNR
jgi:hypothetical protein